MSSSRRLGSIAAFGLAVCAPSIAPAQESVVDSVGIGTATPGSRALVLVQASNVSFTVSTGGKAEVSAVLRSPRSRPSNANYAGALRANATGDTVRIELARALDGAYHLELTVPATRFR